MNKSLIEKQWISFLQDEFTVSFYIERFLRDITPKFIYENYLRHPEYVLSLLGGGLKLSDKKDSSGNLMLKTTIYLYPDDTVFDTIEKELKEDLSEDD